MLIHAIHIASQVILVEASAKMVTVNVIKHSIDYDLYSQDILSSLLILYVKCVNGVVE